MTTPRLIIGIAAAVAAALLGGAELPTPGQGAATSAPTTVFFKFEGPSSPEVFTAMKQEMTALFRGSPFRFDWRRIEQADEIGPVENLVVMRSRGDCRMTFPVPPIDEQACLPGPK